MTQSTNGRQWRQVGLLGKTTLTEATGGASEHCSLQEQKATVTMARKRVAKTDVLLCFAHITVTSTVQKGHAQPHAAGAGVSQVLGLSLPNSGRAVLKHPTLAAPLKAFSLEFPCYLPTHGWTLCWADCDTQLTTLAPMWSLDMILRCFQPTLLSYGILFTGLCILQDTPPTFHIQHQRWGLS